MRFQSIFWLLVILALLIQNTGAQQWPQWRGPNRDGLVSSFSPPVKWPEKLTQKWKTSVGGGYSSPIVSESKIYVHTRTADQESVSCIDLGTGKIVWSKNYAAPFIKNPYAKDMEKGPFSTPVLHQGMLYTLGSSAILSCFDAKTGNLKWRKDYSQYADTTKLFCGAAMSPVVDRGLLLVYVGDDRKGWMIAFDAENGKE